MKNLLMLVVVFAALALPAAADLAVVNITWNSPFGYGPPARAGTITAGSGAMDFLDGQGLCNAFYPSNPPFFTIIVQGGIEVFNGQPVCGNNQYYIIGSTFSDRADSVTDHLRWDAASWYPDRPNRPPNTPNTQQWAAACSVSGTDINGVPNNIWGEQYIENHVSGTCWGP